MLLIWKNKGLLVLLYIVVSFLATAILLGVVRRNVGGFFSRMDFSGTAGLSFLIAAAWTYLTKDDYYKDKNGEKKKMEIVNEFFFIRMERWVYILVGAALIFIGNSIFHYFKEI